MAQQYPYGSSRRPGRRSAHASSQSSIAVVFRALVMLACLVLIPLAALFGTKLPSIFQEFRGGGWQTAAESARQAFSEAPPFQSAMAERTATERMGTERMGTERMGMNPADEFQPAAAWPTDSTGSMPSNGYPAGGAATVQGYPTEGLAAPRIPALGEPPHMTPAATFSAATPPAAEQGAMLASYESRVDPASTFDRFTYIQRRLRQLGATYYLLESWGAEGEYFRFHCRMAVGGNENYTQHFEATEADALEAMARVLSEVEAWRGGS